MLNLLAPALPRLCTQHPATFIADQPSNSLDHDNVFTRELDAKTQPSRTILAHPALVRPARNPPSCCGRLRESELLGGRLVFPRSQQESGFCDASFTVSPHGTAVSRIQGRQPASAPLA